jgi:hypothetical protein
MCDMRLIVTEITLRANFELDCRVKVELGGDMKTTWTQID